MHRYATLLLVSACFLLGVKGCGPQPDTGTEPGQEDSQADPSDEDGDGFGLEDGDCDDGDAAIHPDADERCDGIDNDCDGEVDGDDAIDASTWYLDYDGDGYGGEVYVVEACERPSELWVEDADDCDDLEATTHPDADESCDGIDNDCDGEIDEDDATDVGTWCADSDGDGHGDPTSTVASCDPPSDHVDNDDDCDDDDATINPAADERCDGIDNDCDGLVDDDDPGVTDPSSWYGDGDGDGFGDPDDVTSACTQPSGTVADPGDCDDDDSSINPDASEVCDGVDNDCDGDIDSEDGSVAGESTWYADSDGDGYGDPGTVSVACTQPTGTVADYRDCDDGHATAYPGADELCDGIDNDCDGDSDEDDALDASQWSPDLDGDGWGDESMSVVACSAPSGWVATTDPGDCLDTAAAVYPGAPEICGVLDFDCDGELYDADATDATRWYADNDGDGHGDPSTSTMDCVQPPGFAASSDDCDDGDAAVNPDASEIPDGLDNDCDGLVDPEDCSNGSDDDLDGLTDCEDGDCASDSNCTEEGACLDFIDNDNDGLTDCDDDECWADCGDAVYRARVTGGQMLARDSHQQTSWTLMASSQGNVANGTSWRKNNSAWASSVTGVISIVPSSRWSGSPVATCQWGVSSAHVRFTGTGSDDWPARSYQARVSRDGFTVESGCGWSDSGFLPWRLIPDGRQVFHSIWWSPSGWGAWSSWYRGSLTASTRSTQRSSWTTRTSPADSWWSSIATSNRIRSYSVQLSGGGDIYPNSF